MTRDVAWRILLPSMIILEAAWAPIFWHFIRAWRRRGNPKSLAIAVLVLFMMFLALSIYFVNDKVDVLAILVVNQGLAFLVCANFYFAMWKEKRLFKDTRGSGPSDESIPAAPAAGGM